MARNWTHLSRVAAVKDLNLHTDFVNLSTGDNTYTVAGVAADDVVLDGAYVRFSGGAVQTAGSANVNITAANTMSFNGTVSTGLGMVSWIDISA